MHELRAVIEELWSRRGELDSADPEVVRPIREAVDPLDIGAERVAEVVDDHIVVHEWLKQAILLFFATASNVTTEVGPFEIVDKVPLKTGLDAAGVRALPGAIARWGAFIERGAVLMPVIVEDEAQCALIIKRFAEGERHDKAALNEVLRTHGAAL